MPATNPPSAGLAAARQLFAGGKLPEARQAVEALLRTDPNNVDVLLLAAEIYRTDNPPLAFKVYARAAQLAPQRPEAPAALAWFYLEQGDLPKCDKCLDVALEADPEYLRVQHYAGMAAAVRAVREKGKAARTKLVDFYDSIAAAYQRALTRQAHSPLVAYNLGRILYVLGEPALAYDMYKQALALDPEMTEAYAAMAEVCFTLEQFEETVEWCKMIEGRSWQVPGDVNNPQWMTARTAAGHMTLGRMYLVQAKVHLWMGQFEAMQQAIVRAFGAEPWTSAELYRDILGEHVKLGRALLENAQLAEAIQVLEAGREMALRTKYHRLFLWLAEAYLAQALACQQAQDRKQAEKWLAEASELVKHPPVPVPEPARAAWQDVGKRLTLGDKPSPFGFLRK